MNSYDDHNNVLAHLGDDYDRYLGAIVPPIFQNTLFTRKNQNHGYSYSRINNPNLEIVEKKLAALEHAESAAVFSSGMGAITATLAHVLGAGDHAVVLKSAYFPVTNFFREGLAAFGVEHTFVSEGSVQELEKAIQDNTKLIYLESPSSNIFRLLDLEAIADFAKARGITTIIDNTWATPLYQKPLELGIDFSVHSATKYLGGHSDLLAGVVMGREEAIQSIKNQQRSNWGSVLDPTAAWLLTRSLRTLDVRMERHCANGQQVAEFLESHPAVETVYYPGLASHPNYELGKRQMSGCTGLMSFTLKNKTPKEGTAFVKRLHLFEEGPSWGGFESVANTPGVGVPESYRMQTDIPEQLIRISIGLEQVESIIADMKQSLDAVPTA